ncbi:MULTISPECIES: B3/B4 domain-containing protein [Mesobacillus]|uniref:tRNA synthetase subunit beta n=2 Tax=Mesobacillus TaxID=2675231 RepID=A0A0D6ZBV9_9BACI|nr:MULTISPECIES: phenylalanine--tRNA ligase beta subunit-related protein [Mesobacillus]KIY23032.1 tRNA synthetase subunit beta [Mesobacillus subterraneus]MDQ0414715.1 DNA/RNA-binding domain of Phe-tRNA-synthetase-like protein [Mesobacillus stamsii]
MEVHVSDAICGLIPGFTLGIMEYQDVQIGESPQMLKGRLQLFQESIYFDLLDKNVTELEGIKEWRGIFKTTGKDPNRYRHSAEALYRRIAKQNYLQSIHSAIDLNNFFSLEYQVPIGIYDSDKLQGPITIKIGEENEEYAGLNGRANNLANLIVTADASGPFGSPFVDSERTAVTEETRNALQIVYLRPSSPLLDKEKMTASLMNMFTQIHGGTGTYRLTGC